MDEYISRNDALLHSEIIRVYSKDYGNIDVVPVEYLADIPAADVQPVKRGKWISEKVRKPNWKGVEHDYFQPNSCSVCHTGFAVRSNFCPNCGARMGGDTE